MALFNPGATVPQIHENQQVCASMPGNERHKRERGTGGGAPQSLSEHSGCCLPKCRSPVQFKLDVCSHRLCRHRLRLQVEEWQLDICQPVCAASSISIQTSESENARSSSRSNSSSSRPQARSRPVRRCLSAAAGGGRPDPCPTLPQNPATRLTLEGSGKAGEEGLTRGARAPRVSEMLSHLAGPAPQPTSAHSHNDCRHSGRACRGQTRRHAFGGEAPHSCSTLPSDKTPPTATNALVNGMVHFQSGWRASAYDLGQGRTRPRPRWQGSFQTERRYRSNCA